MGQKARRELTRGKSVVVKVGEMDPASLFHFFPFTFLSVRSSFSLISLSLSVYQSTSFYFFLSVCLSVYTPTYLSVSFAFSLSLCLPSICLLSSNLSVYL